MAESHSVGSGLYAKPIAIPHLLNTGGFGKILRYLHAALAELFTPSANLIVEEYTNPKAADVDAIRLATACAITARTLSGSGLSGVIGGGTMTAGRNVTVTTSGSTPADAPASVVITGMRNGEIITETLVPAGTAATVAGVKIFDKVTSIAEAAAASTDASLSYGFGVVLGMSATIKSRAGMTFCVREIVDGGFVTTGTFSAANQSYTPATAPNDAHDYCILYEAVP
jgi:hypothetical protein